MPIYEYQCERCRAIVERLVRSASDQAVTHDDCGGTLIRQVSSPVTRTSGGDQGQSGDTDSMRRFRENRTLEAEKRR